MIPPTHAVKEFFNDIQDILERGMEFNLFKVGVKDDIQKAFVKSHGLYGAAFYFLDEQPQSSEDCVYGDSPEQAITKALERWR